jgi:hypothetical protein
MPRDEIPPHLRPRIAWHSCTHEVARACKPFWDTLLLHPRIILCRCVHTQVCLSCTCSAPQPPQPDKVLCSCYSCTQCFAAVPSSCNFFLTDTTSPRNALQVMCLHVHAAMVSLGISQLCAVPIPVLCSCCTARGMLQVLRCTWP